ncbi:B3 DNA binding domain [Dillenia turbinata]|uniref:B3 DNA binding domain n=1 Tax=Dillenia turbinata TaxID=194707 RepID=A0AAN8UQ50_9MAGN
MDSKRLCQKIFSFLCLLPLLPLISSFASAPSHPRSSTKEIPKAFVKHLKGKAPGIVSLRAPSGNTWRVKLIRKGNALWFSNGWSTFVCDNSSEFGDLFVFKYRGHMRFNVQIFDKSACEKKSAVDAECSQKMSDLLDGQKAEKNVNDNSASSFRPSTSKGVKRKASSVQFSVNSEVIILSDDSESEERVAGRKKYSASALLSQTRDANLSGKPGENITSSIMCLYFALNFDSNSEAGIGVEDDNEPTHDPGLHPGDHFLEKQATDGQGLAVTTGHPLTSSESDSNGNKASNLMSVSSAFDTDTPILVHHIKKYNIHGARILSMKRLISFRCGHVLLGDLCISGIRQNFVRYSPISTMVIPSSFYHRYISFFRNRANFVLRTPDGASYTVKLVKSYRERRVLSAGWSSFIRHNSIEVGDACVLKEEETCNELEDLEQLMFEIGNMRDNLRLMPDFQRSKIAAQSAMKLAIMFGGSSEHEDGVDRIIK